MVLIICFYKELSLVEEVKDLSLDVVDGVVWLDVLNDDGVTNVWEELSVVDGVMNVWESSSKKDSSELKGEESLFAFLVGCGIWNWVVSEKRMKLRKCGYKSGSFG